MKILKITAASAFILIIATIGLAQSGGKFSKPMEEQFENSLRFRELQKPVFESIILDDMEKMGSWKSEGIAGLSLTSDRSIDGESSLQDVIAG